MWIIFLIHNMTTEKMTNERWHYSVLRLKLGFRWLLSFVASFKKRLSFHSLSVKKIINSPIRNPFFNWYKKIPIVLRKVAEVHPCSFYTFRKFQTSKLENMRSILCFSIWNYSSFSTSWLLYMSLSSLKDMLHFNKADCLKLWNLQTMDLLFIKWVVILSTTDIWNKMKSQNLYWNRVLCTNMRCSIIHIFENCMSI